MSLELTFTPRPDGAFSGIGTTFTGDPSREELQELVSRYGHAEVVELCEQYLFPHEGQSTDVGDEELVGDIEAANGRRAALKALLEELKPTENPTTT